MLRMHTQQLVLKLWLIVDFGFGTLSLVFLAHRMVSMYLDQSNVFENVVNGVAPAFHFVVNNNVYEMGYYLTDWIYPPWSISMQSIGFPNGCKDKLFVKLQEAKCKEIERAFGVLQVCNGWLSSNFSNAIVSFCVFMFFTYY